MVSQIISSRLVLLCLIMAAYARFIRSEGNGTTAILLVSPDKQLLEALEESELNWAIVDINQVQARSLSILPPEELLRLLHGSPLGTGVYLPHTDILDTQAGGLRIFTSINEDAVIVTDVSSIEYIVRRYESTNTFYNSLATEAGISGNYGAISASLSTTFSSVSGGEEEISALTLNAVSLSKLRILDKNKLAQLPLNQLFFEELQALPVNIAKPRESSSWTPFQQFLSKWGSHYISAEYMGSIMQQWSTSKSSKSYSQTQLKAHACLKLEGLTSQVEGCAGVTTDMKQEASKYEMNDKLYVKGGTAPTRSALTASRTKELVSKFMKEGASSGLPVQYKFNPIWEVVFNRFAIGSTTWQIGRNLQAYYEGYMGFGCPEDTTKNSKDLQYFEGLKDGSGNTHFRCLRSCEGCKNDDDCHIGAGGAKCYCYGSSCVVLNHEGRAVVRHSKEGGTWDGVNKSCKYKFGVRCYCKGYDDDKACNAGKAVLWDQTAQK